MKIEYKTKKMEKICTIASEAQKAYGVKMMYKIHQRISEIKAAETVEELVQFHVGKCHQLQQKRKNQYAMDLAQPMRLVFEKKGEEIQIVQILEIVDYH